jgi:hypothetical protein
LQISPIQNQTLMSNRPVHRIPCLRHFWHFACGAGSHTGSKRER